MLISTPVTTGSDSSHVPSLLLLSRFVLGNSSLRLALRLSPIIRPTACGGSAGWRWREEEGEWGQQQVLHRLLQSH